MCTVCVWCVRLKAMNSFFSRVGVISNVTCTVQVCVCVFERDRLIYLS